MKKIIIKIDDLLAEGDYPCLRRAGDIFFEKTENAIKQGFDKVVVEYSNKYTGLSSIFYNAAYAPLVEKYGIKAREFLSFTNILRSELERTKRHFDDYEEFYSQKSPKE